MENNYYNLSYYAKQKAKKYISLNKFLLLFLGVIFLVALITGIFTGIKGSDNISISNINDKTLIKFFKSDTGPFSFFITRVAKYLLTLLFIFVCGKLKFCFPLLAIFIAYMSYSLGLNSAVFIILFGLSGTINAIIVIIPINVLVLAVYIFASCVAIKNSQMIKKYGICLFDGKMLCKWLWFLAVLVVITLVETLLINVFSSAFIFNF